MTRKEIWRHAISYSSNDDFPALIVFLDASLIAEPRPYANHDTSSEKLKIPLVFVVCRGKTPDLIASDENATATTCQQI